MLSINLEANLFSVMSPTFVRSYFKHCAISGFNEPSPNVRRVLSTPGCIFSTVSLYKQTPRRCSRCFISNLLLRRRRHVAILAVVLNVPVRCELPQDHVGSTGSNMVAYSFPWSCISQSIRQKSFMLPHRAGRTSRHASVTPRVHQAASANHNQP